MTSLTINTTITPITSRIKHHQFMNKHARKLHKRALRNEAIRDLIGALIRHGKPVLIVGTIIAIICLYTTIYELQMQINSMGM